MLGHSPMARTVPAVASQYAAAPAASPSPSGKGPAWGVDSNTAGGGVWAQTSSKRDKLNELLTELNADGVATGARGMEALDLAASAQEKLDLELADGLRMVAKFVDDGIQDGHAMDAPKEAMSTAVGGASLAAEAAARQVPQLLESASSQDAWARTKFEAVMREVMRILSAGLRPDPDPKRPAAGSMDAAHPFCYLRDFMENTEGGGVVETANKLEIGLSPENTGVERQTRLLGDLVARAFSSSTRLYRILLLRAVSQTLLESWEKITAVTSGDIDRAALSKTALLPQRSTLSAENVRKLFDAYAEGSSTRWVRSWWNLIDADGDGLIDEEEMNSCIELAMKPVHLALSDMLLMTLEVCPARRAVLGSNETNAWLSGGEHLVDVNSSGVSGTSAAANANNKLSWRDRRREVKACGALIKTFQATLARHFRDQVETPHRLRCIYAWAEKSHQHNKVDSVLVDAGGEWGAASSVVGRKRYVELEPKISYPEFRRAQERYFPHLDRVGGEIVSSFKEDLWVLQGRGRQNRELRRDCFLFLLGVSLVDAAIMML